MENLGTKMSLYKRIPRISHDKQIVRMNVLYNSVHYLHLSVDLNFYFCFSTEEAREGGSTGFL